MTKGHKKRRHPALSASRAKDYMQCPLKFRYFVVDALPQPPSTPAIKGTVVHDALERLFDLPPAERTPEVAISLLPQAWETTLKKQPEAKELFVNEQDWVEAQSDCEALVEGYFRVERPQNLRPRGREEFVDARLDSGVLLRGIIDRLDEAPDGALRVVDYKTGKAPSQRFINDALFQMKFYALLLRQTRRLPTRLQLLYLRSARVLTLDPDPREIEAFEQEVDSLWARIKADAESADFQPRKSPLCPWCPFQSLCPQFGGRQPAVPAEGVERLLSIQHSA